MIRECIDELRGRAVEELGVSNWHEVTQREIDGFAAANGDRQWIHTDPERARLSPFGATVAHGYYTLSLAPTLLARVLSLDGFAMVVNYRLEKLRFRAPLRVGGRVRMRARLDRVEEFPGGAMLALALTFECADGDKPACVAQAMYRVVEEADR